MAKNLFNKIKLEATILDALSSNLTYNVLTRNCNTSTNYFAQKYLSIQNIFIFLPFAIYQGYSDPFYNPNSDDETDVTIKTVRNIMDKYNTLVSGTIDLDNVQYGVVNQSDGWYVKFTSAEYNYVFAGTGSANIVDISGDSYFYADTGSHTIHAGDGNDFVEGGQLIDTVYSGSGFNQIYTYGGNDIVYTTDGLATDFNEVYLGAGNDTFRGGEGSDYVDGGTGNRNHDNGKGNLGLSDTVEDINDVDLGGGTNRYYGSAGTDIVKGSGFNNIYLGAGSDEYVGGDGTDIVDGGSIGNPYSCDDDGQINVIKLGGGTDEYKGGIGTDKVWGGNDADTLYGIGGTDYLYGEEGDDFLNGGDGYDTLEGGINNDYIDGGEGNDTIFAGTGYDTILPGTGVNDVDCGLDNDIDVVKIDTNAAGIDTITNAGAYDEIWCYGGFNLGSISMSPNHISIWGNRGNKINFLNVGWSAGAGKDPVYKMLMLHQPDGTIWEWTENGYCESGRRGERYDNSSTAVSSIEPTRQADLLIQAMNAFAPAAGAAAELSGAVISVSEMCDLACSSDLSKKAA